MKYSIRKSILLTSIFLAPLAAICQISITAVDMPSANDTIRYSTVLNSIGINFEATGENKSWDFTNLKLASQDIYHYKNSTSTPYILSFGFTALGLKIADSIGSGQIGFKDVYNFFKKSSGKWENVGVGFQLSALPLPQAGKHTNTDEIFQFPLNYKDKDSSAFSLIIPLSAIVVTIGAYFQDGNRVNTVDGWGKISTPYKSDVECIRIKSMITETDSISASIPGQPPINFKFPNNRVEYKWLSKTEKIPMLEVTGTELGGTFTPTIVRYRDNYRNMGGNVSIKTHLNPGLIAYPNPAKDMVTIEVPQSLNQALKLFVFDMEGKIIENTSFELKGEKAILLNTSRLSSGKYNVIIKTETSAYYTSVTILN